MTEIQTILYYLVFMVVVEQRKFYFTNDMRSLADTAAFIAVYPQAAVDPTDGSNSWLHKAPTTHNDVNFIEAIIDTLRNQYSIDNDRVYACGYSEGGIFSYELGCRLNNRIAAFSSVSGSMLVDAFRVSYYNLGNCFLFIQLQFY